MLLILTVLYAATAATQKMFQDNPYAGYKVVRLIPQTPEHLAMIHKMEQELNNLDFWTHANRLNQTADVMISPRIGARFQEALQTFKIPSFTLIDDVQHPWVLMCGRTDFEQNLFSKIIYTFRVINEENKANDAPINLSSWTRTLSWNKYHRLDTIHQYLQQLAETNPDTAKIINIGESSEGRSLKLIKICSSSSRNKSAIWIDAGIHAREWIAPATSLYIIDQLLNNYAQNKDLVELIDWYILPVVNPDGYEYSHTNDRLWRKTRSSYKNSLCTGVDGNRNFDYNWNQGGSSSNPCSQTYHGPYAFSEPETKAIAKFIVNNNNQIKFFLSLHSYSQLLLLPWGHTSKLPDDFADLENVGKKAMTVLTSVHGTSYEVGNSNQILYPTSGSSSDWAKGIAGINYSYVLELRDKGRYGFVLPPSQILPTGQETWEAVKIFAKLVSTM